MKRACLLSLAVILSTVLAIGQDCKSGEVPSLTNLENAIHRVTKDGIYLGWDEKTFNRSGDLAAVAIVKTIPDTEITSPDSLKAILSIVHMAFACPTRCVSVPSYRQPSITLLLLEHLQNGLGRGMQADIDETRKYVLQKTQDAE